MAPATCNVAYVSVYSHISYSIILAV